MGALFSLGALVATPAALERAEEHGIRVGKLLGRHLRGDWGDLDPQDKRANWDALQSGARILSSYGEGDRKLWIITEATGENDERASTCVLRPEDY